MRGKEFLEKFSLIDDKFIEEAEQKTKRKNVKIAVLIAACFMLVLLVAALPFFKREAPLDANKIHNAIDTTERPEITHTPSPVYDGIPYSELDISDTGLDPELENVSGIMADMAPFYEEFIADAVTVVEGRVKDVSTKQYEYTTDFDKFGDGGKTHYRWYTVIYEIEVEKIYMGELGTQTLFIEDTVLSSSMFYLKEDHRYVLPLVQASEDVDYSMWQGNIVEGSNKREHSYSNLHPYVPHIEITEDGYYLFYNKWTTLAACEDAVTVTMDLPYDFVYFEDKMMLIDSVNFEKLFEEILTKYN